MRRPELNPALDASPRPDHAAPAHPRLIGGSRLRQAELEAVGSRDRPIRPEAHVTKDWEEREFTTSELFVAGKKSSFERLSELLAAESALPPAFEELREIEEISSLRVSEKVRPGTHPRNAYELVLHLPSARLAPHNRSEFLRLAEQFGVEVEQGLSLEVRGLWFVPAVGTESQVRELARYSTVRVARPMPALALAPIARSVQIPTRARLPRPEVVDAADRNVGPGSACFVLVVRARMPRH